jgi:SWI/SNF-related matrix-associated actin-dependent regulator 1 of chromatin subfamily A
MRGQNYVYDFEIDHTHNYFANEILVSNCHELRTEKTVNFKSAKGILKGKEHLTLLTGTPIVNEINDMASILDLAGILDSEFGGRWKFNQKYGDIKKKDFEKSKNKKDQTKASSEELLKDLNLRLRATIMIRREKYQVLKDLPDKIRTTHEIELSNRKEYDHAYLSLQDYMVTMGASNEKITMALRAEIMVQMSILKKLSAKGKIDDFVEFANELFLNNEKLVLFGWHKEILHMVKKIFPDMLMITGDESDEQIRDNVHAFQNDPKVRIIGATYKRGGVGLTLVAAHHWACLELPWTDAILTQAEARIDRIGQKETVYCHYFLGKDTIDQYIYDIIFKKRNISKHATNSKEEIEEVESDNLIKTLMEKAKKEKS